MQQNDQRVQEMRKKLQDVKRAIAELDREKIRFPVGPRSVCPFCAKPSLHDVSCPLKRTIDRSDELLRS